MARYSGDTILRYVTDAPLRKLRSDLGPSSRAGSSTSQVPFGPDAANYCMVQVRVRLKRMGTTIAKQEADMQDQARDVIGMVSGVTLSGNRIFVHNKITPAAHYATPLIPGILHVDGGTLLHVLVVLGLPTVSCRHLSDYLVV